MKNGPPDAVVEALEQSRALTHLILTHRAQLQLKYPNWVVLESLEDAIEVQVEDLRAATQCIARRAERYPPLNGERS